MDMKKQMQKLIEEIEYHKYNENCNISGYTWKFNGT
jgi:hypothetical protein